MLTWPTFFLIASFVFLMSGMWDAIQYGPTRLGLVRINLGALLLWLAAVTDGIG